MMRCYTILAILLSAAISSCNRHNVKLGKNDEIRKLYLEGLERRYIVHHPPQKFKKNKMNLLLVLHGGGGKAEGMMKLTKFRFNELSDQHGLVVVYPQGYKKHWNDGRKDISEAHRKNLADSLFMRMIIERIKREYAIHKVFATGMSNGGFMSYRIACDLNDIIHGIMPVTANLSKALKNCTLKRSLKVAIFNGTKDPLVPYDGGQVKVFFRKRGEVFSTEFTAEFFAKQNHCKGINARTKIDTNKDDNSYVEKISYICNSSGQVVLFKIHGGGHTWPSGWPYLNKRLIGTINQDIDAAAEIFEIMHD